MRLQIQNFNNKRINKKEGADTAYYLQLGNMNL